MRYKAEGLSLASRRALRNVMLAYVITMTAIFIAGGAYTRTRTKTIERAVCEANHVSWERAHSQDVVLTAPIETLERHYARASSGTSIRAHNGKILLKQLGKEPGC